MGRHSYPDTLYSYNLGINMLFKRLCRVEVKNIHTGLVSIFDQSLRIEFEYSKSIDHSEATSSGWVKIYNLSQDTVQAFGGARFSQVTVYTGYESDPSSFGVLFRADVTNIKYQKDRGTVTTIELSNNFTDLVVGQKVVSTVPENRDREEVLNRVLALVWEGKASQVVVNKSTLSKMYPFGFCAHGTKKAVLDEFCRANDIQWTILNGASGDILHLESRVQDGSASYLGGESTVLNSDSGLIGLPYLNMEKITKNMDDSLGEDELELNVKPKYKKDGTLDDKPRKKKKVAVYNVSCKALIDSSVNPQTLIRIETEEGSTDGLYRVQDAKFTGDTFGNEWYMTLDLRNGNETATVATTGQTKTASKKPNAGSVPKNASNFDTQMRTSYSKYGFTESEMAILKGQVEYESSFNPLAKNPTSSAEGLGQFIDSTAKRFGVLRGDSPQAIASQLDGQAAYMRFLKDRYSGNMDTALTAYYAGEGNMDKFLANGTPLPAGSSSYAPSINAKATKYKF